MDDKPGEPYGLILKKDVPLRLWPWLIWILCGLFGFGALIGFSNKVYLVLLPIFFYGCIYIHFVFSDYTAKEEYRRQGFLYRLSVDAPWLRIQFLTAIALMLCASVLLGLICAVIKNEDNWKFDTAPVFLEDAWRVYRSLATEHRYVALAGIALDTLIPVAFVFEQALRAVEPKKGTP